MRKLKDYDKENIEYNSVAKGRYDAIDGLRAYSAIGIVLMHVLANGNYEVDGFVFEKIIPSFTNLVFLFMVVSAFSMCCGYYKKIINKKISLVEFYNKRYAKILPYFALLCIFDLIISPSMDALYEVFANLTLCFGLLPNPEISVIGVGWFLGLVFVFYLLFPFFCYLLTDKRRAWISFIVAIVFNYLCTVKFEAERGNIMYSAMFFIAGGLIFMYKEQLTTIVEKFQCVIFVGIILLGIVYYVFSSSNVVMLVMFSFVLIYTLNISGRYVVLYNPFTRILSNISMEIYLSHMLIFRIVEKLGILHLFENDMVSYIFISIITIVGVILFVLVIKKILCFLKFFVNNRIVCN